MTGLKVDIKPIEHLYPENLIGAKDVLGTQTIAKLFEGTDLYVDSQTGELKTVLNGKVSVETFDEEAAVVRNIRAADTNGDNVIDMDEATAMIQKSYPKDQAEKINPEEYLKGIDNLIKKRYAVLEQNLERWKGELSFKPTLDALEVYNFGIYLDDVRQADSVFPLNGIITKTGGNILSFLPVNAARIFTKGRGPIPLLPHGTVPDNWLPMDAWAEHTASGRYEERKAALAKLNKITEDGIKAGEKWALEGNFDEALGKLSEGDRDLLTVDLPGNKIHEILSIADDKQRYTALKDFAEGERPGFLGYFGGNATGWSRRNWFNWTGRHNNTYFARSVLSFLGSKAATADTQFNDRLHQDANSVRKDILGEGGGFTNMISWGLTGVLHLVSLGHVDQTPWRTWGDEAVEDGLGRAIDAGLMIYTSARGLGTFKEAWKLRGVGGLNEVWGVMRKEFRPWPGRFFPTAALEARRLELEAQLAEAGEDASKAKRGWFGRRVDWMKDKMFGKLPPVEEVLNPGQLKALKTAGSGMSKFGSFLTNGAVILYITQAADKKFEAHYNPYETDHELDMDPYPDPLKPDPLLYPTQAPAPAPVVPQMPTIPYTPDAGTSD